MAFDEDLGSSSPEYLYLELEDLLGFYADLFGYTGQEVRDRVRNLDGLGSALARPRWVAQYEGVDIAHQAAVLAHGIAEGQHFLEGNKRTAVVSMTSFLELNGYDVSASERELFRWIRDLGKPGDEETQIECLASQVRASLVPPLMP